MQQKKLFYPPKGSFPWALARLKELRKLSAEQITLLIKRNFSQDEINAIIGGLTAKGRRGRPPTRTPAQFDFDPTSRRALQEYARKLKEYTDEHAKLRAEAKAARDTLARARFTPAEKARAYVLKKYGPTLGIKKLGTLRNLISKSFRKLPDFPVEHEELEALWDSQQSEGNSRECNQPPDRVQTRSKREEEAE